MWKCTRGRICILFTVIQPILPLYCIMLIRVVETFAKKLYSRWCLWNGFKRFHYTSTNFCFSCRHVFQLEAEHSNDLSWLGIGLQWKRDKLFYLKNCDFTKNTFIIPAFLLLPRFSIAVLRYRSHSTLR